MTGMALTAAEIAILLRARDEVRKAQRRVERATKRIEKRLHQAAELREVIREIDTAAMKRRLQ